jgi:hypothetical protein
MFFRLGNFLRFSPRMNAVRPGRIDQFRDPLDVCMFLSFLAFVFDPTFVLQFSATLPLPRPLSRHTSTQGRSDVNPGENVSFDYLLLSYFPLTFAVSATANHPIVSLPVHTLLT